MKYTSIAVFALLGNVSAESIAHKLTKHKHGHGHHHHTTSLVQEGDSDYDEENDRRAAEFERRQADLANSGTMPTADLWNADVKYSDTLANGDVDDNKEIEDEDDPNDDIVDDNGFAHNVVNPSDPRLRAWYVQTNQADDNNDMEEVEDDG